MILYCLSPVSCNAKPALIVGAQLSWESICLTSRGSQVRALLFPPSGLVVQLVRTLACHARGRGFEPHPGRHLPLQLSRQSRGLKILVSLVRFRPEAPFADLAHLVERHLAKVEVASSSLVIRSIFWRYSQVVRQRSATPLSPVQIWQAPLKRRHWFPLFLSQLFYEMCYIIM